MTLKCQNCGKELPDFPRDEVERGDREEIVSHTQLDDTEGPFTESTTDYYCNPECFVNHQGCDAGE